MSGLLSVCVEGGGVSHRLLTRLIAQLALSVALKMWQTSVTAANEQFSRFCNKQIMIISTICFENVLSSNTLA